MIEVHGKQLDLMTRHYPGYGGPETWVVEIVSVTDNKKLQREERFTSSSGYGYGFAKLEQEIKHISKKDLEKLISQGEQAWEPCSICEGRTDTGNSSSLGNKVFCESCNEKGEPEKYREEIQEQQKQEEYERDETQKRLEAEEERIAARIERLGTKINDVYWVKEAGDLVGYTLRRRMSFVTGNHNILVRSPSIVMRFSKQDFNTLKRIARYVIDWRT